MAVSGNIVIAVVFLVILLVIVPLVYFGCGQFVVWLMLDAIRTTLAAAAINLAGEVGTDAAGDKSGEDGNMVDAAV